MEGRETEKIHHKPTVLLSGVAPTSKGVVWMEGWETEKIHHLG